MIRFLHQLKLVKVVVGYELYISNELYKFNKVLIRSIGIYDEINDETIAKYFGFNDEDKEAIQKLHTKKYKFFV